LLLGQPLAIKRPQLGELRLRGLCSSPAGTSGSADTPELRNPLIVIAGSGIVISDSTDRDHSVGAKRR